MEELNDEEVPDHFREGFALHDSNGEGKMLASQVGDALRASGLNPSIKGLKRAMIDIKSDKISYDLYTPIVEKLQSEKVINQKDIVDGLAQFEDSKGSISVKELKEALTTMGEKMSSKEVDELLAGLGDTVNCEQFAKMISADLLTVVKPAK